MTPPQITLRDVPGQVAGADRRRPADEPAARGVHEVARRRSPAADRDRLTTAAAAALHGARAAGVHAAARVPGQDLPARRAATTIGADALPKGAAHVRLQRPLAHDDDADAAGDSRDRPGGGEAHPRPRWTRSSRRSASRAAFDDFKQFLRTESGLLLHGRRRARDRLSRRRQARRSGAGAAVRHAAAHAVRRRSQCPTPSRRRRPRRTTSRARSPPAGPATCTRTPTSSTRGRSGRWKR